MMVKARMRIAILSCACCCGIVAQTEADYRPPAGMRAAARRPGIQSVLPGGRMIDPLGRHFVTGPGPFGLILSPDGRYSVTANGGPNRYSLSVLDRGGRQWQMLQIEPERRMGKEDDEDDFRSIYLGLAFADNNLLYASEGNSGRVRLISLPGGKVQEIFPLNQGQWRDSYSGDIAYDSKRGLLYVADQAHFTVAVFQGRNRKMLASVKVGRLPFRLALSPDGKRLYVTNVGMFQYSVIPGADVKQPRETGLPFPAFGFPSAEAKKGARRETARGPVDVPGLGDPNTAESNSLATIDVSNASEPKLIGFTRTGLPFGPQSAGGSSPSGLLVTANAIYVSNANQDSITEIDPTTLKARREIPLRIPGLEGLRGVLPLGLAFHAKSGWLLVAEAGINAVGVIEAATGNVLGHVPAAWFPTAVAVENDTVFVSSAKGFGTGPNANKTVPLPRSFQAELRNGSLGIFDVPAGGELAANTARVMMLNGFQAHKERPAAFPEGIRHVVLIVKENRTYDEVFGALTEASNGALNGAPELARLGSRGWVTWDRSELLIRLGKNFYNITPNHQAMAARWAFSDNFYADSEVSVDGHHWLVGSYPNAWTETTLRGAYGGQKDFRLTPQAPGRLLFAGSNSSVHPEELLEAGTLWHHLERHGVSFRNFGEGFELAGADEGPGLQPTGARYPTNIPMPDPLYRNTSRSYPNYNTNIPDQFRASQFISEIDNLYVKPGKELPRFIFVHLPNDHMARPRPEDGYPFQASYVADNDYALGRMIEYLSHTPWWRQMAIFVTEDDAQGGIDHVDSHRTVLLAVSPYAKKNYATHVNRSFPAILKSVFRILRIPPLNLFDAAAADLADCFTTAPDFTPYAVLPADREIFIPENARDPLDPKPGPRMDDPNFLRQQHRQ